jgi:hypothetical protein
MSLPWRPQESARTQASRRTKRTDDALWILFASPIVGGEVVVDLFVYVLRPLRLRSAIDYVELERLRQRDAGRQTLLRGWPFLPGWFLTADDFLARRSLLLVLLAPGNVLFLGHRLMLSPQVFADNCDVFGRDFSPIATDMTGKKIPRLLTSFFKHSQRAGGSDDLTEREARLHALLFALSASWKCLASSPALARCASQYSSGSKIQIDGRSASVITQSLSPALVR